MRRIQKTKDNHIFYTIMTDVLFNLLAYYMLSIGMLQDQVGLLTAENGGLKDKTHLLTDENKGFKIQIGELNIQTGGLNKTISDQSKKIGSQQKEIDKHARFRSGNPVTVMILIDVTISMGEPIKQLGIGMETICEIMPNRSQDFRVGVLAFRKGVVARYPITKISPAYEDNRASQRSILSFIRSLEPKNSFTNHLPVFREAIQSLAKVHKTADPKRETIIVFIGDVGPSELDEKPGYSAQERESKSKIISGMTKWARIKNRSVKSLYAMSDFNKDDPSGSESRQWYEQLGSVSPKSAFFTDTTSLLQDIHHATDR